MKNTHRLRCGRVWNAEPGGIGTHPSLHVFVFTSPEAPFSSVSRVLLGFYVGMSDGILGRVIELRLRPLSPLGVGVGLAQSLSPLIT